MSANGPPRWSCRSAETDDLRRQAHLTAQWLAAPDTAAQQKAGKALSHVAMTDVATVPVGQWYGKTAFRRSITGVLQGVSSYPWNVRPA